MNTEPPHRTIEIELLALDLKSCARCVGTDRNLGAAIDAVSGVLRETGAAVNVTRRVVTSAAEAQEFRMMSSPTIRVDGRDIALELRESSCKDCGDLCGCEGAVDCRVWVWQGREHLEAPKPMIVDAILRAYAAGPREAPSEPYRMPDNLKAFFASLAAAKEARSGVARDCCDRSACCGAEQKTACCGTAASAGTCGCQ